MAASEHTAASPHIPVLIDPLIAAVSPVSGVWVDGTFGAGGYTRRLLESGADKVIAIDRDPLAFELAADWAAEYSGRIDMVAANFADLDRYAANVDGVVLDLGVSSMQLDRAERGFSFIKDGPLDMRMGQAGPTAADFVNQADEAEIADVLYHYGEERQSRKIARAIVADRPFSRTLELAGLIERILGRGKRGQAHPATRAFQAIRIAINDEFGALVAGLEAAERALKAGGKLAVVTFHSLEDRIVKRFFQSRSQRVHRNKYAEEDAQVTTPWELLTRKAVGPDREELARNPRSRSAKLRVAMRTAVPSPGFDREVLGLPRISSLRLT